jgi:hypothetical protein
MSAARVGIILGLLLAGLIVPSGSAAGSRSTVSVPGGETVRGVVISTHTDGRDWGSDRMEATMRQIKQLGAGWVAIHPYAGIRADGRVRFWEIDPADPPPHIVNPIRMAHSLGLKILIKPHLAYWGSPFRWRGEIRFEGEEQWRRFWQGYERWIVTLAAACREADGFAVGTELDLTLGFEEEWRRIIREVRRQTSAPLTYSANWDGFEAVPFWDALDAIGIQAYFPLTDEADTGEESIRRGWERWMGRLRAAAAEHNRAIVFTELGYSRSYLAPARPWDYRTDGAGASQIQETCMRLALEAIESEPSVVGAFLWKWFPGPRPAGRNFQLATPGMKRVIREAWTN